MRCEYEGWGAVTSLKVLQLYSEIFLETDVLMLMVLVLVL